MSSNSKLLNIFKFSFPDTVWEDPEFTNTTDEQLEELLEFVSATDDLSTLTPEDSYGVFLSARKEMYWKLATSTAPLYEIKVDGTEVYKDQRFTHYLELIQTLDEEIKVFLSNGGSIGSNNKVSTGNAYLTNRHFSIRNYENTAPPIVTVNLDTIYSDKVEISWSAKNVTKFFKYEIYISYKEIVDPYKEKNLGGIDVVNSNAKSVFTTFDKLQTKYRILNLAPNTTYHLAVICFNCNTVYGYDEVTFNTIGVM